MGGLKHKRRCCVSELRKFSIGVSPFRSFLGDEPRDMQTPEMVKENNKHLIKKLHELDITFSFFFKNTTSCKQTLETLDLRMAFIERHITNASPSLQLIKPKQIGRCWYRRATDQNTHTHKRRTMHK